MRTERNKVILSNHLHAGEPLSIPKDIHSKALIGFNNWKQSRIDSGKPLTTELPNPWRKRKSS